MKKQKTIKLNGRKFSYSLNQGEDDKSPRIAVMPTTKDGAAIRHVRYLSRIPESPSIRAESKDDKRAFIGTAVPYNKESRLIWDWGVDEMFREVFKEGAFDEVLADDSLDIPLLIDHNPSKGHLGRTKSGNLEITSDDEGLQVRASVPETALGNDTFAMVERGDYDDMSFAFTVGLDGETWTRDADGTLIHTVHKASGLYDVTICTMNGAYGDTEIDAERALRMIRTLEDPDTETDPNADPDTDPDPDGGDGHSDDGADQDAEVERDISEMEIDIHKAKY